MCHQVQAVICLVIIVGIVVQLIADPCAAAGIPWAGLRSPLCGRQNGSPAGGGDGEEHDGCGWSNDPKAREQPRHSNGADGCFMRVIGLSCGQ